MRQHSSTLQRGSQTKSLIAGFRVVIRAVLAILVISSMKDGKLASRKEALANAPMGLDAIITRIVRKCPPADIGAFVR